MTAHRHRLFLATAFWLLALVAPIGAAQRATGGEPPAVTADLLEARIAETDAAADLSDEAKKKLLSLYREALDNLGEAASHRASAQAFQKSLQTAPIEARAIREDMDESNVAEPVETLGVDASTSLRDMESVLQREKGDFAVADTRRADLSQRLGEESARPAAIRQRLQAAAEEQDEILAQRQLVDSSGDALAEMRARRWVLESRGEALSAEIEMLDQELLSHPARVELLEAKRDKAAADAERMNRRIALLEDLVTTRRQADAQRAKQVAEAKRLGAEGRHPLVVRLAEQNAALSNEIADIVSQLDELTEKIEATDRLARRLEDDFKSAQEVIAIGGANLSDQLGNLLRQQRQSLPDPRSFEREAREREIEAAQIGASRVLHRREQQRLMDTEAYVAGLLGGAIAEETPPMRARLVDLATERRALLEKAIESEDVLLRKLGELEAAQTELLETITGFDELLDVHLLWVRSASRTELEELGALPEQVWRIVSPSGWYGAAGVLAYQATHSAVFILLGVVLGALLWFRKHLIGFIETTSEALGKPTTDRFAYSLQVLAVTLVAAAAWPLVAAVAGWQLRVSFQATDFSIAVGGAVLALATQFYFLRAFRLMCIPRGLAAAHFRWPEPSLRLLRRELDRLSWTYLPAAGVTLVIVHLDPLNAGWAVGRVAFVVLVASLAFAFFRLLHPRSGVLAQRKRGGERRRLPFLHQFWYPLLIMAPLALGVLAVLGYLYTAGTLLGRFVDTAWMVVALIILAALAQRWLAVTRRRIAYETAMERRRAALEARRQTAEQGEGEDMSGLLEVEEPAVDLESLSDTSSDLITTAVVVSGLIGLWVIWSDLLPALRILDNVTLWHQTVTVDGEERVDPITLADLGLALVFGVATFVLAKQLPAILEIILLRRFDMTAGSRYTFTTLTTYAVVTAGILLAFNTVGAQWSQLQWLVAALGVGIGFGLQEIVANFISGLIILFERPIRVGDVVTVGDTDGVVTKIRIRATTIRNWDRKELLVPNKEFVTGRLLNWSLSDQMTRVVIVVGVAYGSDVDKALALMREAAEEHEHVLDDPAPVLSFEGFGDNSLTLILRAYLSSIDHRIATITDLHKAINRKLAEAGIVIAFPQRDLHLDTSAPLQVELKDRRGGSSDTGSEDAGAT
jgi:potassium efflux system protein